MALPAHLYRLWGEASTRITHDVQGHNFARSFLHNHFRSLSFSGDDNARIPAETVWWEKNTVVYNCPVLIYLHLHKDIGMTFCTSCFCYFLSCICTTCDPLCVLLAQVDMYAGALFIQLALQWDIYLAVVLLLSVTALYTVAGDLSPSVSILNTSCLEILRSYCLLLVSLSCLRWSGCSYLHRCCTNCYHAGRISYPHGLQ